MLTGTKEKISEKEYSAYSVGGLLYIPGLKPDISQILTQNRYPDMDSAVLCLEDSINDNRIEEAEASVLEQLSKIADTSGETKLPNIFIRVRSAAHMLDLYGRLGAAADILMGFVLPKYDTTNAESYASAISRINSLRKSPLFVMPTLESHEIIFNETSARSLFGIKCKLDEIKDYVLNIRVGGNDFCNIFGLRRNVNQSVYDIGIVRDILIQILNIFSRDYVLSAPVWEYFASSPDDNKWEIGLKHELELDMLNGFIGKTAIHPTQLPVIREALMVDRHDYEDAERILNWTDDNLGVGKSSAGNRMNEMKVHEKWAKRVLILSRVYGIKEQ